MALEQSGQHVHSCSMTGELRCTGSVLIICLLINAPGNTFRLIIPHRTAAASSQRTSRHRAPSAPAPVPSPFEPTDWPRSARGRGLALGRDGEHGLARRVRGRDAERGDSQGTLRTDGQPLRSGAGDGAVPAPGAEAGGALHIPKAGVKQLRADHGPCSAPAGLNTRQPLHIRALQLHVRTQGNSVTNPEEKRSSNAKNEQLLVALSSLCFYRSISVTSRQDILFWLAGCAGFAGW